MVGTTRAVMKDSKDDGKSNIRKGRRLKTRSLFARKQGISMKIPKAALALIAKCRV